MAAIVVILSQEGILFRLRMSRRDAPTVPPPFSLKDFARDTERKLRAAAGGEGPPAPTAVPRVRVSNQELRARAYDHRAGFVLSLIDGSTSVEGIVDISGIPKDDVVKLLERFRAEGVIELD
jgi:hypothetical protein